MNNRPTQLWKNHHKRRYYRVQVTPDLFGDLCLMRSWGSLDNGLGNCKMELLAGGWAQAQSRLVQIGKQRLRRGYEPCTEL